MSEPKSVSVSEPLDMSADLQSSQAEAAQPAATVAKQPADPATSGEYFFSILHVNDCPWGSFLLKVQVVSHTWHSKLS